LLKNPIWNKHDPGVRYIKALINAIRDYSGCIDRIRDTLQFGQISTQAHVTFPGDKFL
jgi:hypothetical protein